MSCQQVPTTPAFNLYPRSVQVGEFEVAIDGGIWVAIRAVAAAAAVQSRPTRTTPDGRLQKSSRPRTRLANLHRNWEPQDRRLAASNCACPREPIRLSRS